MGWQDHLEGPSHLVAPWLGERDITRDGRSWRIRGANPRWHGWYRWMVRGRVADYAGEAMPDLDYVSGAWDKKREKGYLVGNRLILLEHRGSVDPNDFEKNTVQVELVEPGLDRFTLVEVGFAAHFVPMYRQELFPLGPEDEVRRAFVDRKETVDDIAGVTPALDLAFRFATRQRQVLEERRAEMERIREEERRREEAMRNMGTGLGRRTLASTDFETAARAALAVGGADLLDVRQGRTQHEMVASSTPVSA